jgi:hypothetical protein
MKISIFLCLLTYSYLACSAEADNFTPPKLDLADVSVQINTLARNYLLAAVKKINAEGACDQGAKSEQALYLELRKYFANHSKGALVKEILYTKNINKYVLPLKESVYGEWSPFNGYLLGNKKAALSPLALSPLIRIGDQVIGVDKLEHLFGMGFIYFTQHYLNKKPIQKVLKSGIFKEKTYLGGNVLATGVFSYADLSANFNGMRFWNHMLLKNDDILGADKNVGPYISCINSQWTINENTPIDFRNYIDSSMDESINCSKFATKSGVQKFKASLKKLNVTCSKDPGKLQDLQVKYSPFNIQHYILNDDGTDTVSYFNEF